MQEAPRETRLVVAASDRGPWLLTAQFVETIEQTATGALRGMTLVSELQMHLLDPEAPDDGTPDEVPMTFLLMFASGADRTRTHEVVVALRRANGERRVAVTLPLTFETGDPGERQTMLLNGFAVPAVDGEVLWVDVRVDGERLTSVPLRVREVEPEVH